MRFHHWSFAVSTAGNPYGGRGGPTMGHALLQVGSGRQGARGIARLLLNRQMHHGSGVVVDGLFSL